MQPNTVAISKKSAPIPPEASTQRWVDAFRHGSRDSTQATSRQILWHNAQTNKHNIGQQHTVAAGRQTGAKLVELT